ncbi:MAG: WbqC family protein, partial [Calditrichae bacterium]|nr:WbqC family protein [Calditrichia bacterium]
MLTIKFPSYLPETRYFFDISFCSNFILADHLNYRKRSSLSRTIIGNFLLTIPTIHCGNQVQISQKKIAYNENWQSKHIKFLYHYYHSFAYFDEYFYQIEELLSKKNIYLIELLYSLLQFLIRNMHLEIKTFKASESGFLGNLEYDIFNFCMKKNINSIYSFEENSFLQPVYFNEKGISFHRIPKLNNSFLK